jgi:hypothetical protein
MERVTHKEREKVRTNPEVLNWVGRVSINSTVSELVEQLKW